MVDAYISSNIILMLIWRVCRVVTFLRSLRILILVRIFRLASQKKELEKVTRRMVSDLNTKEIVSFCIFVFVSFQPIRL